MFVINLLVLILCGAIIGYERQQTNKVIGVRSIILLMLGAFIFTFISVNIVGADKSRVLAQIVSGCSFIGAGIIIKSTGTTIANLTTAILVWTTAALGCLIGLGFLKESVLITAIIYGILRSGFLKNN